MLDRKTGLTNNKVGFSLKCLTSPWDKLHVILIQKNHTQEKAIQKQTAEKKAMFGVLTRKWCPVTTEAQTQTGRESESFI